MLNLDCSLVFLDMKGWEPEWANPKWSIYWKLHELHKNEVHPIWPYAQKFGNFEQLPKHILRVFPSLGGGSKFNSLGLDHSGSQPFISCSLSLPLPPSPSLSLPLPPPPSPSLSLPPSLPLPPSPSLPSLQRGGSPSWWCAAWEQCWPSPSWSPAASSGAAAAVATAGEARNRQRVATWTARPSSSPPSCWLWLLCFCESLGS